MERSFLIKNRLASAFLRTLFTFLFVTTVVSQTVQPPVKKEVFSDEDLKEKKVGGKWTFSARPDLEQKNDPSTPLVVKGVATFSGQGKYTGLHKIRMVEIQNRSLKAVQSLQLRWTIAAAEDLGMALLEGFTPPFNAMVEADKTETLSIPPIFFNQIIKPLLKDGELHGDIYIVVGAQEVRFTDGSVWQRPKSVAYRRALRNGDQAYFRPPFFSSLFFDKPLLQGNQTQRRLNSTPCKTEPQIITAAFFFPTLQEVTDPECKDTNECYVNADNQHRCRLSTAVISCDLFGCYEGYCGCWTRERCSDCPDSDGDGFNDERCGGTDCRDDRRDINPDATERCRDGIDNNCNKKTDGADFHCIFCAEMERECNRRGGRYVETEDGDCSCEPRTIAECENNYCCGGTADCDGFASPEPPTLEEILDDPQGLAPAPRDCCSPSPVLVDVSGDGFDLTDAQGGVRFDIRGDGKPLQVSWTAPGSDDAWLALDRDGNGTIDSGAELFGNFTEQVPSPRPNGFRALARFDQPEKGGNGDRVIDSRDAVFSSLRLWQDANHNGVSEVGEMKALASLRVVSFSLDYTPSLRRDAHGNQFRYRAPVNIDDGRLLVGRWAWDVFLVGG